MAIAAFPPIKDADEEGLLAVGGDMEVSSLLLAYSQGIFPWPLGPDYPLAWFSPDPRGILRYKDLILNRSLKKTLRSGKYVIKFNHDFHAVILGCSKAKNRKGQEGTWITEDIILSFINLHHAGHAYSVETYLDGTLVGGMYGVQIGSYISGESMFYQESDASKVALVTLMELLHEKGIEWIDTQLLNPFLESMGTMEIPRAEFANMLEVEIKRNPPKNLFA